MHIIIFKTSVATETQVTKLKSLLTALPFITQCNFDLEDCDNILRIVTVELQSQMICELVQTAGFNCEIMESFIYQQ